MKTLYLILYVVAVVMFLLAALTTDRFATRVNLVALGLAAWVLVPLIELANT